MAERRTSPCRPLSCSPRFSLGLNHPPLHDAHVLAARGDEVAVTTEEVDVGDVTAVSTVDVARSLGKKDTESSVLGAPRAVGRS